MDPAREGVFGVVVLAVVVPEVTDLPALLRFVVLVAMVCPVVCVCFFKLHLIIPRFPVPRQQQANIKPVNTH
ncbi:hypothetical protein EBB79_07055 [Parasedimentitalea marina]|uniref:Uncharacterized protein n=1 Tax=Parasedimentitalea marina TaxID=2483033 RepID=A0A3T0N0W9_9RHOB|nr:hypothetical protein EBB79_07055 [Parasedimentitalea marina]